MLEKLIFLYGEEQGKKLGESLRKLIHEAKTGISCEDKPFWDERDVFLITYPDSFQEKSFPTLTTLKKFLDVHPSGVLNGVHILPFYPYSSDRGFSITDYQKVKKEFGSWDDISSMAKEYRLMADLVLNHVSVKHVWFQRFLAGDPKYENYFIWFDKDKAPYEALKKVFRPRATPLLTPFKTAKGERWVWTTFSVENSTDQVDLNYKNPEVLIEIIKILIYYLTYGIRVFRLDAVAYIWKEIGTTCKHLPQVHKIVSILRRLLDELCPSAVLITEVNAPYKENTSYFGGGQGEAQMVYNFSLPSLVLDAFYRRDASHLSNLAKSLSQPSERCTYFNFLDTHDGVGILGAKGILSDEEIKNIFVKIKARGGKLSLRKLTDGSETVYEMNTTWWSALNPSSSLRTGESFDLQLNKFITSRAISFALKGVPAVYYLSLIGGENDLELYAKTGIKRNINRSNLDLRLLELRLKEKETKESRVFSAMLELIKKRKSLKAFHPSTPQQILNLDDRIFSLIRGGGDAKVLCLHNLTNDQIDIKYGGRVYRLTPYSYIWQKL